MFCWYCWRGKKSNSLISSKLIWSNRISVWLSINRTKKRADLSLVTKIQTNRRLERENIVRSQKHFSHQNPQKPGLFSPTVIYENLCAEIDVFLSLPPLINDSREEPWQQHVTWMVKDKFLGPSGGEDLLSLPVYIQHKEFDYRINFSERRTDWLMDYADLTDYTSSWLRHSWSNHSSCTEKHVSGRNANFNQKKWSGDIKDQTLVISNTIGKIY